MSKAFFRIGAGLRCAAACVIISAVPPQWEVKDPRRNEIKRDNETISAPRKRPTASRSIFHPFAGRGFCKWK